MSDLLVVQLFRWRPRPRRRGRPGFLARWWRNVVRAVRWHGVRSGHTSPEYRALMRSAFWRKQKARVLARDGYRCRACGARRGLEAHHEWYARPDLTKTPDAAIVTLCQTHHLLAHHNKQGPTSRRLW